MRSYKDEINELKKVTNNLSKYDFKCRAFRPVKTEYITIRLSPKLKAKIMDIAFNEDVAVATVVRRIVENHFKKN